MILCETGLNFVNNKGCSELRNFAILSEGEIVKVFGLNFLFNEIRINVSSFNILVFLLE